MPRYFFDLHDDSVLARDTYGIECEDKDHVRDEAIRALPDIVRNAQPTGEKIQVVTVLVRDEYNMTVFTATLNLAGFWLGDTPIPEPEEDPFD